MNRIERNFGRAAFFAALAAFLVTRAMAGEPGDGAAASSSNLTIYAIDVGQGDSALILFPDGSNMLIDTGKSSEVQAVIDLCHRLGIGQINKVVISHGDADHDGGYGDLWAAGLINGSTARYDYGNTVPGQVLHSGTDLSVTCVTSNAHVIDKGASTYGSAENDLSVGVVVRYKGFDYLSCGDLESEGEEALGQALAARSSKIDVLKVDHHGSRYSSPLTFLQNIHPEFAVIMVGDNSYGHPTQETIDRLNDATVRVQGIFQTEPGEGGTASDVHVANGQVVITTNGATFRFANEGQGSSPLNFGPYQVDEDVQIEQPPHLLISEIAIDTHTAPLDHPWIEFYLPPDASECTVRSTTHFVTDLDYVAPMVASTGTVTIKPGEVIVLHNEEGPSESNATGKGANGWWDFYAKFSGTQTWNSWNDEFAVTTKNTYDPAQLSQGDIIDAVVWSNDDGEMKADQMGDGNRLIQLFHWGDPVAGSGLLQTNYDYAGIGNIKLGYAQRLTTEDTDSVADWAMSTIPSLGTPPPTPTPLPTPPPTPAPPKFAQITTNASSLAADDPFRVSVAIKSLMDRPFDAYAVIIGPPGVFSIQFGNALVPGVRPIARNVLFLPEGYYGSLLEMAVPRGIPGDYQVILGLADAGAKVTGVGSAFAWDVAYFSVR